MNSLINTSRLLSNVTVLLTQIYNSILTTLKDRVCNNSTFRLVLPFILTPIYMMFSLYFVSLLTMFMVKIKLITPINRFSVLRAFYRNRRFLTITTLFHLMLISNPRMFGHGFINYQVGGKGKNHHSKSQFQSSKWKEVSKQQPNLVSTSKVKILYQTINDFFELKFTIEVSNEMCAVRMLNRLVEMGKIKSELRDITLSYNDWKQQSLSGLDLEHWLIQNSIKYLKVRPDGAILPYFDIYKATPSVVLFTSYYDEYLPPVVKFYPFDNTKLPFSWSLVNGKKIGHVSVISNWTCIDVKDRMDQVLNSTDDIDELTPIAQHAEPSASSGTPLTTNPVSGSVDASLNATQPNSSHQIGEKGRVQFNPIVVKTSFDANLPVVPPTPPKLYLKTSENEPKTQTPIWLKEKIVSNAFENFGKDKGKGVDIIPTPSSSGTQVPKTLSKPTATTVPLTLQISSPTIPPAIKPISQIPLTFQPLPKPMTVQAAPTNLIQSNNDLLDNYYSTLPKYNFSFPTFGQKSQADPDLGLTSLFGNVPTLCSSPPYVSSLPPLYHKPTPNFHPLPGGLNMFNGVATCWYWDMNSLGLGPPCSVLNCSYNHFGQNSIPPGFSTKSVPHLPSNVSFPTFGPVNLTPMQRTNRASCIISNFLRRSVRKIQRGLVSTPFNTWLPVPTLISSLGFHVFGKPTFKNLFNLPGFHIPIPRAGVVHFLKVPQDMITYLNVPGVLGLNSNFVDNGLYENQHGLVISPFDTSAKFFDVHNLLGVDLEIDTPPLVKSVANFFGRKISDRIGVGPKKSWRMRGSKLFANELIYANCGPLQAKTCYDAWTTFSGNSTRRPVFILWDKETNFNHYTTNDFNFPNWSNETPTHHYNWVPVALEFRSVMLTEDEHESSLNSGILPVGRPTRLVGNVMGYFPIRQEVKARVQHHVEEFIGMSVHRHISSLDLDSKGNPKTSLHYCLTNQCATGHGGDLDAPPSVTHGLEVTQFKNLISTLNVMRPTQRIEKVTILVQQAPSSRFSCMEEIHRYSTSVLKFVDCVSNSVVDHRTLNSAPRKNEIRRAPLTVANDLYYGQNITSDYQVAGRKFPILDLTTISSPIPRPTFSRSQLLVLDRRAPRDEEPVRVGHWFFPVISFPQLYAEEAALVPNHYISAFFNAEFALYLPLQVGGLQNWQTDVDELMYRVLILIHQLFSFKNFFCNSIPKEILSYLFRGFSLDPVFALPRPFHKEEALLRRESRGGLVCSYLHVYKSDVNPQETISSLIHVPNFQPIPAVRSKKELLKVWYVGSKMRPSKGLSVSFDEWNKIPEPKSHRQCVSCLDYAPRKYRWTRGYCPSCCDQINKPSSSYETFEYSQNLYWSCNTTKQFKNPILVAPAKPYYKPKPLRPNLKLGAEFFSSKEPGFNVKSQRTRHSNYSQVIGMTVASLARNLDFHGDVEEETLKVRAFAQPETTAKNNSFDDLFDFLVKNKMLGEKDIFQKRGAEPFCVYDFSYNGYVYRELASLGILEVDWKKQLSVLKNNIDCLNDRLWHIPMDDWIQQQQFSTWISSFPPIKRVKYWRAILDDIEIGKVRFSIFLKRELQPHGSYYNGRRLPSNPRIIFDPPAITQIYAGPILRRTTHLLHKILSLDNNLTYFGGLKPDEANLWIRRYVDNNFNLMLEGSYNDLIRAIENDFSKMDSCYGPLCFAFVYKCYRYWGLPMDNVFFSKILKEWETPKGRFRSGTRVRAPSMNASGRADTALMNALINAFVQYSAYIQCKYSKPLSQITTLEHMAFSKRFACGLLGDDSITIVEEMPDMGNIVSKKIAEYGFEARDMKTWNHGEHFVFLGQRLYPVKLGKEPTICWGPTIGRRLYRFGHSSDQQPDPLRWLKCNMYAADLTYGFVPILGDIARRTLKLLEHVTVTELELTTHMNEQYKFKSGFRTSQNYLPDWSRMGNYLKLVYSIDISDYVSFLTELDNIKYPTTIFNHAWMHKVVLHDVG